MGQVFTSCVAVHDLDAGQVVGRTEVYFDVARFAGYRTTAGCGRIAVHVVGFRQGSPFGIRRHGFAEGQVSARTFLYGADFGQVQDIACSGTVLGDPDIADGLCLQGAQSPCQTQKHQIK